MRTNLLYEELRAKNENKSTLAGVVERDENQSMKSCGWK